MLLTYFPWLPATGALGHKAGQGEQLTVEGQYRASPGKYLEVLKEQVWCDGKWQEKEEGRE